MITDPLEYVVARFFEKSISVAKLKEILSKLQDTDLLYPNRAGNLLINRKHKYIAYIDIGEESIEKLED